MSDIDYSERIEQIDEAQEKLQEVIDLIEAATEGLECQGNVKAYMIDHLKIAQSSGHGFLSNDLNLDKIRENIEEEQEEGENCKQCEGEGVIEQDDPEGTTTEVPCKYCNGTGKTEGGRTQ